MLKRLSLVGALACAMTGAALATPIPAASSAPGPRFCAVPAKMDRGPGGPSRVRRPYLILLSMGALVSLVAPAVIAD